MVDPHPEDLQFVVFRQECLPVGDRPHLDGGQDHLSQLLQIQQFFQSPHGLVIAHVGIDRDLLAILISQIGDLSAHYKFLTAMIDGGLKQLAVMGTMHEVGYWEGAIDGNTPCNPISMYGIAKDALRRAMILHCKQKGCILQWLRCYYILGDDKRNNSIFCKLLLAAEEGKKTFPFTTGKNQYDFITVDELANQLSAAVMQKDVDGIINCCTGKPLSLAERVEQFIKEHKLEIKLEYGAFPDRPYDSPCEYGDPTKINLILSNESAKI